MLNKPYDQFEAAFHPDIKVGLQALKVKYFNALIPGNLTEIRALATRAESNPDFPQAVAASMHAPDAMLAISACLYVLMSVRVIPDRYDQNTITQADAILAKYMRSIELQPMEIICGWLPYAILTPQIESILWELISIKEIPTPIALVIIAALAQSKKDLSRIHTLVIEYFKNNNDPTIRSWCVLGMLQFPPEDKASGIVATIIKDLSDDELLVLLHGIHSLGMELRPLKKMLKTLVNSNDRDPRVRGVASRLLGLTGGDTTSISKTLLDQLTQHNCPADTIIGIVDGMRNTGKLNEAVPILFKKLESPVAETRHAAAVSLALVIPLPSEYFPKLLARFQVESDIETLESLGRLLLASGDQSVDHIFQQIHVCEDTHKLGMLIQILSRISEGAVLRLAELLLTSETSRISSIILAAIGNLGRKATPAVPILCKVVDSTPYFQLRLSAVMIIVGAGLELKEAIRTLAGVVKRWNPEDDASAHWSMLGLMLHKEAAIPILREMMGGCDEIEKTRLENALKLLVPLQDPLVQYVGRCGVRLVDVFLLVVAKMIDAEGETSVNAIARELASAKKPHPLGKEWSEDSIRRDVAALQEQITGNPDLLDRRQGRPTRISEAGLRFYFDALKYRGIEKPAS